MPQALRVHGALMMVSIIYGCFYIAVKLLFFELSTSQFMLMRFALTGLLALVIERVFIRGHFDSAGDFWRITALGLLGVLLVQIMMALSIHFTTAFHTSLLIATAPVITTFIGQLTRREPYNLQKILGILIAFCGVAVLLFFSKNGDTPLPETYLLGDVIALATAFCFALFLIGSHRMLKKYNSFSFMTTCYAGSALLFTVGFASWNFLSSGYHKFDFIGAISQHAWLLLAFVVIFASIGTYTLNNYALSKVTPSTVAIYMFIQPVVSAVFGSMILKEPFNLAMGIAALVTFAGVMIAMQAKAKDEPEEELVSPIDAIVAD